MPNKSANDNVETEFITAKGKMRIRRVSGYVIEVQTQPDKTFVSADWFPNISACIDEMRRLDWNPRRLLNAKTNFDITRLPDGIVVPLGEE